MMREGFKAKKKNGNCHFVTVIHSFSTNSSHRTWNKLPKNVENALNLYSFKKRLDDYMTKLR